MGVRFFGLGSIAHVCYSGQYRVYAFQVVELVRFWRREDIHCPHVTSSTRFVRLTAVRIEQQQFGRRMSYRTATSKSITCRKSDSELNFSYFSFTLSLFHFPLRCVRNVLSKAKELGLQTIGICSLNIPERNYPAELAAHIALSKAFMVVTKYPYAISMAEMANATSTVTELNFHSLSLLSLLHLQNQFESSSRRINVKL